MAAVAPHPLDLTARGASPALAGSGGSLSARGPAGGGGFEHLTFDSSRATAAAPDKVAERDRLRNKLVDVGQRFVGFDKVVESDTIKRRQAEKGKLQAVQEGVMKLERALNAEIKRRVEANKQVQSLTESLANDMLERLQSRIIVRIEKLASSIESLTFRCTALEKGISQFRGELPSKLQVDTAALVKEISELRRHMETDRRSRIERDTALLRRLAEMETHESEQFDRGMEAYRVAADQLKTEIDNLARTEEVSDSRTEKFRAFILEEIAGMKNTLAVSAQAREQTDDEIVQAMNQYTNALQKGLNTANQRSALA